MYRIKLEQFEGPLDLLLELIDKKKLSVNEVSLAEIADQYLEYLKKIENFPIQDVAAFIVVAATLMLIKSRSLMPSLKLSEEEKEDIEFLEARLREYKRFRALSRELEKIFGKRIIFGREAFLQTEPIFIEPADVTVSKLSETMARLIENIPQREKETLPETLVKKTVSLEQKIDELIKMVESKIKTCFSEIQNNPECKKVDLIITFLALLELTKRGLIIVKQSQNFGEIEITKHEPR
ncbi:MAG: hypothetical protein COT67_02900 [Candidatus Tagabacteria bacterium CG09_land_8_20_14_0_10_41_14]|uniref:Segregation and condensation protein A n=2 Tax=Candidatus Tagaibacteriota TaxID=1817918 RepID=A0A2H0WMT9_9BACT|nr:MAG: hypothetical protein COT67_02900 [Candidatus Tagabacteria bacterium CG09_land_8_20_14_0_10_41_14]PJE72963.1 MAG: hypothetical protein COV00_02640 [Candidatus Tagabacteria bacterium CG10_big_fil_rev_8_21_14_0_10_40_13]